MVEHVETQDRDGSHYNLEERLLDYAARIVRLTQKLPQSPTARHIGGQLLRCGTSPMAQHGEAQAAESRKDFVHKMRIALKELREAMRWLKLIQRIPLVEKRELLEPIIAETDELIRIFVTSINTARKQL